LVFARETKPEPVLVRRTSAPAITAVELSVTEPVTAPVVCCAKTGAARAAARIRVNTLPMLNLFQSVFIPFLSAIYFPGCCCLLN
jgi:hypothetical protein